MSYKSRYSRRENEKQISGESCETTKLGVVIYSCPTHARSSWNKSV